MPRSCRAEKWALVLYSQAGSFSLIWMCTFFADSWQLGPQWRQIVYGFGAHYRIREERCALGVVNIMAGLFQQDARYCQGIVQEWLPACNAAKDGRLTQNELALHCHIVVCMDCFLSYPLLSVGSFSFIVISVMWWSYLFFSLWLDSAKSVICGVNDFSTWWTSICLLFSLLDVSEIWPIGHPFYVS